MPSDFWFGPQALWLLAVSVTVGALSTLWTPWMSQAQAGVEKGVLQELSPVAPRPSAFLTARPRVVSSFLGPLLDSGGLGQSKLPAPASSALVLMRLEPCSSKSRLQTRSPHVTCFKMGSRAPPPRLPESICILPRSQWFMCTVRSEKHYARGLCLLRGRLRGWLETHLSITYALVFAGYLQNRTPSLAEVKDGFFFIHSGMGVWSQ